MNPYGDLCFISVIHVAPVFSVLLCGWLRCSGWFSIGPNQNNSQLTQKAVRFQDLSLLPFSFLCLSIFPFFSFSLILSHIFGRPVLSLCSLLDHNIYSSLLKLQTGQPRSKSATSDVSSEWPACPFLSDTESTQLCLRTARLSPRKLWNRSDQTKISQFLHLQERLQCHPALFAVLRRA